MNEHQAHFEDRFIQNRDRHSNLSKFIQRRINRILEDPYTSTELLRQVPNGLDLRGYRSARVDRNFRVIFVICDEYQHIKGRQFSACEGKEDEAVIFVTVGTHDRAYALR